MKKFIILTLILANATVGISQYADSLKELSAENYLAKSRRQKSGAVVLTVVGSIGLAVTLLVDMNKGVKAVGTAILSLGSDVPESGAYAAVPYLLSAAAIVGAIPLYVAAARNKGEYYMLSVHVKFEERSLLHRNTIYPITYPALTLKVQLK